MWRGAVQWPHSWKCLWRPHPGRPSLCGAAKSSGTGDSVQIVYCLFLWIKMTPDIISGDWVYKHASRDGRDGDGGLEADGWLPPSSHSRGLQGPRQSTNTSDGAAKKETEIKYEKTLNQSRCDSSTLTLAIWGETYQPVNVAKIVVATKLKKMHLSSEKFWGKCQQMR